MPYFSDADDVYRFIGGLLRVLGRDDELGPAFRRANTVVQYQFRNPESRITSRLLEGQEIVVDCGETALEPELTLAMEADVAHRFWLGMVSPTVALARGEMEAKGPVAKILKLVPVVKPSFPRYVKMIEDAGRPDLLEPLEHRRAPPR